MANTSENSNPDDILFMDERARKANAGLLTMHGRTCAQMDAEMSRFAKPQASEKWQTRLTQMTQKIKNLVAR